MKKIFSFKKRKRIMAFILATLVLLNSVDLSAMKANAQEANETEASLNVHEGDDVKYLDADGKESVYSGSFTEIKNSQESVVWTAGWYVTSGDVRIAGSLNIIGDVHLILCDKAVLTVDDGIQATANLSIYAQSMDDNMGKLIVERANNGNITSYINGINCTKALTINGGDITAKGLDISSSTGYISSGIDTAGLIINNGKLSAIGGSGKNISTSEMISTYGIGVTNNMTINGGTVTACGGDVTDLSVAMAMSSGIATDVTITINAGTLKATGGDVENESIAYSYGIGACNTSDYKYAEILVCGGMVTAAAGETTANVASSRGIWTEKLTVTGGNITIPAGSEVTAQLTISDDIQWVDILPDEHWFWLDDNESFAECDDSTQSLTGTIRIIPHVHDQLNYIATGNTMTEQCAVCSHIASANIQVSDKTYDGKELVADIVKDSHFIGTLTAVVYNTPDGNAPVNAGIYVASCSTTGSDGKTSVMSKQFTIEKKQIPSGSPEAAISVSSQTETVDEVALSENWEWQEENVTKILTLGKTTTATAIYIGADKANYVTTEVIVAITRVCNHDHTEIKNVKEATCEEDGYTGDIYCTDCGNLIASGTKIEANNTYNTNINTGTSNGATATSFGMAVGKIYIDKKAKAIYRVTASGNGVYTVTFIASTNKNVTSYVIRNTVVINKLTYKVTAIAGNAFKNSKKLKKITIGNNIRTIGNKAFYNCKKLRTVKSGKNVINIGKKAFYKCIKLKSITIDKKVRKIGSKAFYGCKSLKRFNIKSRKLTTKTVGSKAFAKTASTATVKVPKKKYNSYKKLLRKRGISKKTTFRKKNWK